MTFAEKLVSLCEERNWSPAELARRVRVSKNTAGRWMDGETRPYDESLVRLARLFKIPADYLIDDEAEEMPGPLFSDEQRWVLETLADLGYRETRRRLLAVPTAKESPPFPYAHGEPDAPPERRKRG